MACLPPSRCPQACDLVASLALQEGAEFLQATRKLCFSCQAWRVQEVQCWLVLVDKSSDL